MTSCLDPLPSIFFDFVVLSFFFLCVSLSLLLLAPGMKVLTALGGMTSHAAVVARGMGKCCVSGCTAAEVDIKAKTLKVRCLSCWWWRRARG